MKSTLTDTIRPALTAAREQLRHRSATRTARRDMRRYVSSFSSEAQLSEMEAILSRYDDNDDVVALRTIVQRARTAA